MSVPSNLIPVTILQLPEDPAPSNTAYMMYVNNGVTYKVQVSAVLNVSGVPGTRTVTAGTGLTGGGALASNITISVAPGGIGATQLNNTGVTAGVYGDSSNVPVLTVDANGRVTAATTLPIPSISGYVPTSRQVIAGTGLSGGGPLTSNVTLTANLSSATPLSVGSATAGISTDMSRSDHVHPAIDLSIGTQTTGVLGITKGGTGTALTAPPNGGVVYSDGSQLQVSSAGSAGQVLFSTGASAPVWATITGTGTVTNVTGVAPVSVATGTTTPVISMAAANTSTNGYLTSTDWTTFNNKLSAQVYPGLGIPNSTGSAWGASYGVSGTGNVALTSNPVFATDITVNGITVGRGDGNVATNTALGVDAIGVFGMPENANNVAIGTNALKNIGATIAGLTDLTGGSGYTDGTYYNIPLSYLSGTPIIAGGTYPSVDVQVIGGSVSITDLTNGGFGWTNTTTVFQYVGGALGAGSGFTCQINGLLAAMNNTAIGYNAASNLLLANKGIYIGVNAQSISPGNNAQREIVIGSDTVGNGDLTVTIGSPGTTNTYLRGNVSGDTFIGAGSFTTLSASGACSLTGTVSGTLLIGGTNGSATAGTITLGQATGTCSVNVATGSTAGSRTKIVNIGTNGLAGSTTNINLGSTTGTSTTILNGIVRPIALTASQAVFTDASKNLVSVATTGTGSVVLSASPTLTGTVQLPNSSFVSGTSTIGYAGNVSVGQTNYLTNNTIQIGGNEPDSSGGGSSTINIGANYVEVGESYANATVTYIYGDVFFPLAASSESVTFNKQVSITSGSSLSVAGNFNLTGSATVSQNIATNQTSGLLSIGGTSATGTITLGRSTGTQTTNIQAGATASGSTKTMSIGTGGLAGSTTNIAIGSTAGTSTTTLNGAVTLSATTQAINLGNSQTSGVINIGTADNRTGAINIGTGAGSLTTGAITIGDSAGQQTITIGRSTDTNTLNLATGVTQAGSDKTVNIGTNSPLANTNINIGSSTATSYINFQGTAYFNYYAAFNNSINQFLTAVAALPTDLDGAIAGDRRFVNNALNPRAGSTVVGGGSVAMPVYFDGTNWICDAGLGTTTGTGNVVLATSPTLTNPTFTGYTETVYAVVDAAGVPLSPNNGTIQTWTLGANRTPTAGTWAAGQSMTLMIDDGTAFTVTWTTIGVVWVGGTAPTLATTGFTVLEFWKVGSTIYGAFVGNVA